ncbi:uncharacterized protein LOC5522307 [Nematostella vectensis]|uniref:uncharacterized protein LOC5522307 n=1 Tax=Nematostella vectensis TaxID=45351 RepID=UPI0020770DF0|nr:uncharacterized protein LOC5522307 [Nematostella vectensis]
MFKVSWRLKARTQGTFSARVCFSPGFLGIMPRMYDSIKIPILPKHSSDWPYIFWFYLKSLGLFNSGVLVQPAKCSRCAYAHKHRSRHLMYVQTEPCKVCDSLRWNHLGVSTEIHDSDIASSWFNQCGSRPVSLLWLLIITVITALDIAYISHRYRDSSNDIVTTLSLIGSKLLLFIAPLTCFISVLHSMWPRGLPGNWANAVDIDFIIGRLRCVNMKRKMYSGIFIFTISLILLTVECVRLAAPFFDKSLVSDIQVNCTHKANTAIFCFDVFLTIEGYINFGGLVYIVYLLRCSYESEVKLVVKFLRQNIDDVDVCRARLAETFDAFHAFREFSSGFIALYLIVCTVCILLELHVWIVHTEPLAPFQYEHTVLLIFFLLMPIMAIGNVDCDYIWNRLLRKISRERITAEEESWNKVMQFLQEQKPGNRPWQAVLAFVLSTIAIFSAIQFRLWTNNQVISVFIKGNDTLELLSQLRGQF